MYYLVGIFLALSFLAGSFVLWAGVSEFVRRLFNIGKMSRTQGTVVRIHVKYGWRGPGPHAKPQPRNFPVIKFTTSSGAPVTFRSDTGDIGETRYYIGQQIRVMYDPAGNLKPLIDSWSGRWLAPLGTILGGLVWAGFVAFVFFLFYVAEQGPPGLYQ